MHVQKMVASVLVQARKAIDPRDPKFKPLFKYDPQDLVYVEKA